MLSLKRAFAVVLLVSMSCNAFTSAAARSVGEERIRYEPPKDELHRPLYERMKRERWLERIESITAIFRLPRQVVLKVETCGEVDAYFARRTVAVCYEYLHVVVRRIEAGELPRWVTPDEALAGAFVDAMLHEYAHALIEYLRIPVLGREEDAADQLSAHMMLSLGGREAAGLVKGTAHLYLSWIRWFQSRPSSTLATGAPYRETRAHPTPSQRLYNIVCLAVGADKDTFAPLAAAVAMPDERAEDCQEEFQRLDAAWARLLAPHTLKGREAAARVAIRSFVAGH